MVKSNQKSTDIAKPIPRIFGSTVLDFCTTEGRSRNDDVEGTRIRGVLFGDPREVYSDSTELWLGSVGSGFKLAFAPELLSPPSRCSEAS